MSHPKYRKWIVLALVLLAFSIAARFLPLLAWLEQVAASLRSLGWMGVAQYALLYAVAAMLCLPCMPLTVAGGYIFGTAAGLLAVHTGTTLAAAGGFLVGRLTGRAQVAERLRRSERFHLLDEAIGRDGWKITGLLRMLPIAFGPSNYLYGMTAVDFWRYLLATIVAMLPGNLIFCHLGAIGGRALTGEGRMHPLEILALGLGIASMIAVTVLITRILRQHGEEARVKVPDEPAAKR